ncbi:DUF3817 domain-containing protein [Actinoplanes sp. NPDC048796]|uniref:DUF3817 domain-containing protein n=1 Tax=unclassified Actinoplanes TaxID=2626549 RepID=UPI0033C8DCA3
MLLNLATIHARPVTQLLGPLHGCSYLLVIGATLAATRRARPRLLALVPGVGGLLAARFSSTGPPADRSESLGR